MSIEAVMSRISQIQAMLARAPRPRRAAARRPATSFSTPLQNATGARR